MLSYNVPDKLRLPFEARHGGRLLRSASECVHPRVEA
jgi:hypothetical protein